MHTRTHTHALTEQTHTQAHTHALKQTHTGTSTRTHTHIHRHTHTRTHTNKGGWWKMLKTKKKRKKRRQTKKLRRFVMTPKNSCQSDFRPNRLSVCLCLSLSLIMFYLDRLFTFLHLSVFPIPHPPLSLSGWQRELLEILPFFSEWNTLGHFALSAARRASTVVS